MSNNQPPEIFKISIEQLDFEGDNLEPCCFCESKDYITGYVLKKIKLNNVSKEGTIHYRNVICNSCVNQLVKFKGEFNEH